jgi:hypothetical protein
MVSFHKILADGFFVMACLTVFAAAIGWLEGDVWLASTQWLIVGIFAILVAIYTKLSAKEDEAIIKKYNSYKKKK